MYCLNCNKVIQKNKYCNEHCRYTYRNNKGFEGKTCTCGRKIWAHAKTCKKCMPHLGKRKEKERLIKLVCENCQQLYIYNRDKPGGATKMLCIRCSANLKYNLLKKKAVQYKGGKCQICCYYKCYKSLEFHHFDPSIKEFTISKKMNKSWNNLIIELDKCILVCANCHGEIHDGLHPEYLIKK